MRGDVMQFKIMMMQIQIKLLDVFYLQESQKLKNYFLEKIESNEYPIIALHKKGLDCFQNKK